MALLNESGQEVLSDSEREPSNSVLVGEVIHEVFDLNVGSGAKGRYGTKRSMNGREALAFKFVYRSLLIDCSNSATQ